MNGHKRIMFQGCGEFVKNSNDKSNTWRERMFLWFDLWPVTANLKDPVSNMSHPSCTVSVSVGVRFHPQPFIMWMRGWEYGAQVFHVFIHCCLCRRLTRSLMPAVAIPVCKQTFTWVVDCWIHGNFHVWISCIGIGLSSLRLRIVALKLRVLATLFMSFPHCLLWNHVHVDYIRMLATLSIL